MSDPRKLMPRLLFLPLGLAVLAGFCSLSQANFMLFHILVEMFSILVAAGIFVIAWNGRRFFTDAFFPFLGVAHLFVAGLDLFHTLAYKGMGVFAGPEENLATQLWVAARYLHAGAWLVAPLLIGRRKSYAVPFAVFGAVSAGLVAAIFLGWFPDAFVPGEGLTPFKVYSEYVICGLFAGGIALLLRHRERFDPTVLTLLVCAMAAGIAQELAFTLYSDLYGLTNVLGHLLKIVAFYLIYKAFIETGFRRPYSLVFRDLKQAEHDLRLARDRLEQRVAERTEELMQTVRNLEDEVAQRQQAEEELTDERRRMYALLQVLPGFVCLIGPDHSIRFANQKFKEVFGDVAARRCHEAYHGRETPCKPCRVRKTLTRAQPVDWTMQAGNERFYHVRAYPFADTDGAQLVLELGTDITERRMLQSEVLKASELERIRIGQDLHDSLGQMLSGIGCLMKVLQGRLAQGSPESARQATKIQSLLSESVELTRRLARGLSPVGPSGEGLEMGIRELAETVTEMFGIPCSFTSEGDVRVSNDLVANHLYRIAQEAAGNAARHSAANQVRICLYREGELLILMIVDDGVGVAAGADQPDGNGLGLRTMRYRAELIGGSLELSDREGGGTTVRCKVPVSRIRVIGSEQSRTTSSERRPTE